MSSETRIVVRVVKKNSPRKKNTPLINSFHPAKCNKSIHAKRNNVLYVMLKPVQTDFDISQDSCPSFTHLRDLFCHVMISVNSVIYFSHFCNYFLFMCVKINYLHYLNYYIIYLDTKAKKGSLVLQIIRYF